MVKLNEEFLRFRENITQEDIDNARCPRCGRKLTRKSKVKIIRRGTKRWVFIVCCHCGYNVPWSKIVMYLWYKRKYPTIVR